MTVRHARPGALPLAPSRALRRAASGLLAAALLAAGLLATGMVAPPARAADDSFVVDGADGYGTSDCLGIQGACGRVVADALCAARGLTRSLAWRAATPDDVTATAGARAPRDLYVVSCARA